MCYQHVVKHSPFIQTFTYFFVIYTLLQHYVLLFTVTPSYHKKRWILTKLLILAVNLRPSEEMSISDLQPFGAAQGDTLIPPLDDGSSGLISMSATFPFFGRQYNTMFVNVNGGFSFERELSSYSSHDFPMPAAIPVIIAVWTDINTRNGGDIWYRETRDAAILNSVSKEIRGTICPAPKFRNFVADWGFVTTYADVAFFGASTAGKRLRNTFQVILALDSARSVSFAILNYAKIEWTTGNNGGDIDTGLGGIEAMAGFDAGDTTNFFRIPGSRTPAVLDLARSSNVKVPGKWMFNVDTEVAEGEKC